MHTIKEIKEKEFSFVELKNTGETAKAIISLDEGGRLKELKINNKCLIKEFSNFDYKDSYASSILFPFASRIEDGKYDFQSQEYQLNCNDSNKSALHGLVYNKKFVVFKKTESLKFSSVTIAYEEVKESLGFPYTYIILLTYTLFEDEISLSVKIENTDNKAFPFTLGWHPYFLSDDLSTSILKFKSDKKIEFNENLVTKRVIDHKTADEFKIGEKQLDDCFILNTENVVFITPSYQLEISTNQIENYLQLYTPKGLPIIAIELMSGVSNSFNNKIGLQVLQPKDTYSFTWNVKTNKN